MKVRYAFDTDDASDELNRLARGFDPELQKRYDGAARQIFQRAQQEIHVVSGALRSTGRYRQTAGKTKFRAVITYGGAPRGGPYLYKNGKPDPTKNPVKYAYIEYARAGRRTTSPGTSHNWLRFVESDWRAFEEATLDWLKGRRASKFKKGGKGGRRRR